MTMSSYRSHSTFIGFSLDAHLFIGSVDFTLIKSKFDETEMQENENIVVTKIHWVFREFDVDTLSKLVEPSSSGVIP